MSAASVTRARRLNRHLVCDRMNERASRKGREHEKKMEDSQQDRLANYAFDPIHHYSAQRFLFLVHGKPLFQRSYQPGYWRAREFAAGDQQEHQFAVFRLSRVVHDHLLRQFDKNLHWLARLSRAACHSGRGAYHHSQYPAICRQPDPLFRRARLLLRPQLYKSAAVPGKIRNAGSGKRGKDSLVTDGDHAWFVFS